MNFASLSFGNLLSILKQLTIQSTGSNGMITLTRGPPFVCFFIAKLFCFLKQCEKTYPTRCISFIRYTVCNFQSCIVWFLLKLPKRTWYIVKRFKEDVFACMTFWFFLGLNSYHHFQFKGLFPLVQKSILTSMAFYITIHNTYITSWMISKTCIKTQLYTVKRN